MKFARITFAALLFIIVPLALAQEAPTDKVTVPLSDPARPVMLKIGLIGGSISVKGSAIKEVIVEARIRQGDGEDEEKGRRRQGLRLIPNRSSGLTVEEEDNTVRVSTGLHGASRNVDLTIKVPVNCSMKLSTVNDGHIDVDNVTGDLEVNNTNGSVTLTNISGSVVAHALNEDLVVTFLKVNPQKAMSFSSLNGKIDVTLPSDTKAVVYMKSDMGEIYSDFDMNVESAAAKVEESKEKKGRFRVSMERGMKGSINGGGPEYQFKNFNGDIYIRKGK